MQFHDYKVHEKIPILKYLQVGKYVVQLIAVKDKEKNGANDKVNGGEWSLRSYGAGVADPRHSDYGDRLCVRCRDVAVRRFHDEPLVTCGITE